MEHGEEMIDISTNGNTVWVNNEKGCLARFCKRSSEFMNDMYSFNHDENFKYAWDRFVQEVKKRYSIEVGNEFKPEFVKEFHEQQTKQL